MSKRFRTTMMHGAGSDGADIVQGRVVNVNYVNWTVDVVTTFDRKRYFDIQVSSPYLHFNSGEGIFVSPEIGAVCLVCIPGDSTPPFVLSFIMPSETTNGASDDAPLGTRSHGAPAQHATDASFAGGRPRAKPGDICFRTRDGNFITLHRGGVLSIGATELAQRIYIPLGNLVMDISENYAHHNVGGSVTWGLQDGSSLEKFPTQHQETFRVFANDKFADIRVSSGRVYNPMPEKDGSILAAEGIGQTGEIGSAKDDNPIIYEVAVAPGGFTPNNGEFADNQVTARSVLHFLFDRRGGAFLRCEGSVVLQVRKKLRIEVDGDISITGKKKLQLTLTDGAEIDGGAYAHLKGKIVRIGPGKTPVARLQDVVISYIASMPCVFIPSIVVGPTTAGTPPGTPIPGYITVGGIGSPTPVPGSITTAEPTILV